MRYWKLKDSNRVIAVDCQMSPRWEEITKEQYEIFKNSPKLYNEDKAI